MVFLILFFIFSNPIFANSNCAPSKKIPFEQHSLCKNIPKPKSIKDPERYYIRHLKKICLYQASLQSSYQNMWNSSVRCDTSSLKFQALGTDQIVTNLSYHIVKARQYSLDHNLDLKRDFTVPQPPAELMIDIQSFSLKMKSSVINEILNNKIETPEVFHLLKTKEVSLTDNTFKKANCSIGGFLKENIKSYEQNCRTPPNIMLNNVSGKKINLSCSPEKSEQQEIAGIKPLPKKAYDKLQMCNPLIFGYFPLKTSEKNTSHPIGGQPLCAFPHDFHSDGVFYRPQTLNRWCRRIADALSSFLPRDASKNTHLDMIVKLHLNNPKKSKKSLNAVRNHCENLDANESLTFKVKKWEKESCLDLMPRIKLIEEALNSWDVGRETLEDSSSQ